MSGSTRVSTDAAPDAVRRSPAKNSPYASAVGTTPRYTTSATAAGPGANATPATSPAGSAASAATTKPSVVTCAGATRAASERPSRVTPAYPAADVQAATAPATGTACRAPPCRSPRRRPCGPRAPGRHQVEHADQEDEPDERHRQRDPQPGAAPLPQQHPGAEGDEDGRQAEGEQGRHADPERPDGDEVAELEQGQPEPRPRAPGRRPPGGRRRPRTVAASGRRAEDEGRAQAARPAATSRR